MAENYPITLSSPEERINPSHPAWNKYGDYFNLNDYAPEFTLDAVVNNQESKVSLSDYKGKWVILFFYSSNFSFV